MGNNKTIFVLIIIVLALSAFVLGRFTSNNSSQNSSSIKPQSSENIIPLSSPTNLMSLAAPGNCTEDDYQYIDFSKKELTSKQNVIDFLKNNCLVPISTLLTDVNADFKEDLIISVSGIGCASCHPQDLYVFINDKPIFITHGEDFILDENDDNSSFITIRPLRWKGEALCCPTEGIRTIWKYPGNPEDIYFFAEDERVVNYNQLKEGG